VPELGLGFRPFQRCDERAGHFALLGIHCSSIGLVVELPRAFAGVAMSERKVIDAVARDAVIESDARFPYVIDGDVFHSEGALRLRTGPLLELVIPVRSRPARGAAPSSAAITASSPRSTGSRS
jgi:hypothetical protein